MRNGVCAAMAFAGCVAFLPACTLDRRDLLLEALDAAPPSDASYDQNTGSGRRVHAIDSGKLSYMRPPPPQPDAAPVEVDAGPCPHTDQFGKPDCDKTLAVNSDFNRGISGWTAQDGALLRWVDLDVQDAKNSGSIAVKNAEVGDYDGTIGVSAGQCMTVDHDSDAQGTTYTYAASMYIKAGQTYGIAQVLVFLYPETHCTGYADAYAITQIENTGKWLTGTYSLNVPASVHSMSIRLNVLKPFRVSDTLEALFDAVRVTRQSGANAEP